MNTATQLDEGEWKVERKTDDLYTIILKIYYTLYTLKLKIFTQRLYYSSSKFSNFIQGDVVSSFLCHTHTDGKDKLLEWPDRSCLLIYVSARIH